MTTTTFEDSEERVEWTGSRLAAPGPGKDDKLLGTVVRVSRTDNNSVRVKWDNGRETIERRSNLMWL